MTEDAVLNAVADVVASLASGSTGSLALAEWAGRGITLPGSKSHAKERLQMELQVLAIRMSNLQEPAFVDSISASSDVLLGLHDALRDSDNGPRNANTSLSHIRGDGADTGCRPPKRRKAEQEAVSTRQETTRGGSGPFQGQHQEIIDPDTRLPTKLQSPEGVILSHEPTAFVALERELLKHQKANEAFQKALREIGQIVTAVARGDLTMKVHMNADELDPEIHTFKRTINAMMDKLQIFASEVSRVAREVGTEGLLGGQAIIDGVDGTWKELTDNGKTSPGLLSPGCIANPLHK